jgi:hypothetical protein
LASDNGNCCGWFTDNFLFNENILIDGFENDYCGSKVNKPIGRGAKGECCGQNKPDCEDAGRPTGSAIDHVKNFAKDECLWSNTFREAWNKATENAVFASSAGTKLTGTNIGSNAACDMMPRYGESAMSLSSGVLMVVSAASLYIY